VLLVILRSRNRWSTAPAMLDAAFAARMPHVGAAGSEEPVKLSLDGGGTGGTVSGKSGDSSSDGANANNGGDAISISGSSDNTGYPINETLNGDGEIGMSNNAVIRNSRGKIKPTREIK
jgi:hypothetical protein